MRLGTSAGDGWHVSLDDGTWSYLSLLVVEEFLLKPAKRGRDLLDKTQNVVSSVECLGEALSFGLVTAPKFSELLVSSTPLLFPALPKFAILPLKCGTVLVLTPSKRSAKLTNLLLITRDGGLCAVKGLTKTMNFLLLTRDCTFRILNRPSQTLLVEFCRLLHFRKSSTKPLVFEIIRQ